MLKFLEYSLIVNILKINSIISNLFNQLFYLDIFIYIIILIMDDRQ